MADAGVGVYVAGSGSGEGYSLTKEETRRILEITADEIGGRVPVRAMGSEPRNPDQMIDFLQMVESTDIDAIHVYSLEPGHGYLPKPHEVESYFNTVLEVTSKPVVLSSHMSVGYLIPLDTVGRLIERFDNVIGIVVSSMFEMRYLYDVIDRYGDRLEVISGGGLHGLQNLAFGGSGFATTEANIAPRLARSVIDHFLDGDAKKMFAASRRFSELSLRNTWKHGSVSSIKAALQTLGLPGGPPRPPRIPVPEEDLHSIKSLLDDIGVPEIEAVDDYQ